MDDLERSIRQPDQTLFGWKFGCNCPRKRCKKIIADWADESVKQQTARRNKGIYDFSTDDKHYLKVTVDARAKLKKDLALAMPRGSHCRKMSMWQPGTQANLDSRVSEIPDAKAVDDKEWKKKKR